MTAQIIAQLNEITGLTFEFNADNNYYTTQLTDNVELVYSESESAKEFANGNVVMQESSKEFNVWNNEKSIAWGCDKEGFVLSAKGEYAYVLEQNEGDVKIGKTTMQYAYSDLLESIKEANKTPDCLTVFA
ncbi:hypothetical protein N9137_02245 [Pseudomonadales bacterium]|nr:hypothetical protein [Pseudomonadales bacterium]